MKAYKWTAEQKKALRGSIRKWEKIVDGTGTDEGHLNCPCCKIWFIVGGREYNCVGCPIRTFTGVKECDETPYRQYVLLKDTSSAKAEVRFLKKVYKAGGGK